MAAAVAAAALLAGLSGSPAATGSAPTVTTGGVGGVHVDSAHLHGTVNPQGLATTYHFEYGRPPGFPNSTPVRSAGSGTGPIKVSAIVSGLAPGTHYHYRLVATNPLGTTTGSSRDFTTLDPRLSGSFRMRLVVRRRGAPFRQHPGQVTYRGYRFKAHCQDALCPSVGLRRQGQRGHFRTLLDRKAPGVYGGVERFGGGWCDDGLRFDSRTRILARVTRLRGDYARRVKGTLRPRVQGCVSGSELARFAGRRR